MKTARRHRSFLTALVAVPAGLATLVATGVFLPGFFLSPDLVAVALSGLIIYAFGALALLGRRRPATAGRRQTRGALAPVFRPLSVPAAQIRARVRLHERERLAA